MRNIGVRAPLDLGGRSPYCPKNLHNARKRVLYKRTQTAVKTKTFTFLKSNERIFIPKLQLNPNFWNPQRKRKLVRKIEDFEKSGVTKIPGLKLQCSTEERETTYVSSYRVVRKRRVREIEMQTVVILKRRSHTL